MTRHTEDQHSEMWLDNGIIYIVYKPNLSITLDIAKNMVRQRLELAQGQPYPIFADVRLLESIDPVSRTYLASNAASHLVQATAIFLDTPIISWLANVFVAIDRPACPSRHFSDRDKALSWLQTYQNVPKV